MVFETLQIRDAVASMLQIVALVWAVLVISARSRRSPEDGDLSALAGKVAGVVAVSLAMSLWAPSTGAMIVTAILAIQGLIIGALWLMDLRQHGIAKRRTKAMPTKSLARDQF